MFRFKSVFAAVLAVVSFAVPTMAHAGRTLQCVPFARDASGIEIRGNAKTWWAQAAGKYERGNTPKEGSVLTLPGYGKMWAGHVAMVSKIVNDREILLTHANWSRRGGIERNVKAVDVSDKGDWSRVKIWFASLGDLGKTSYPAYGFIYASRAPTETATAPRNTYRLSDDVIQLASLEG
jgi:surface antigen